MTECMAKQMINNGSTLGFDARFRAAAKKLRGDKEPSDCKNVFHLCEQQNEGTRQVGVKVKQLETPGIGQRQKRRTIET